MLIALSAWLAAGFPALITPGSGTLAGFALAGAGLLAANTTFPRQRALQTLLAVALGTLAVLSLVRALQTASPPASLPSPVTAIVLGLAATILAGLPRARSQLPHIALQLLLQWLCLLILLGSAAQVLNSIVGIDLFDFGGRRFALDWASALALAILAVGLGATLLRLPGLRSFYRHRQDRQIFAVGSSMLLIAAIAAWLIGVGALAGQTLSLFRHTLQSALTANISVLGNAIHHAAAAAEQGIQLARTDNTIRLGAGGAELHAELQRLLIAGQPSGLKALWVTDAAGRILASTGDRSTVEHNRMRIDRRSWLFWNDAYWLELRIPVGSGTTSQGEIVVQARLEHLADVLNDIDNLSHSGELVVCRSGGAHADCFPTRLTPHAFTTPKVVDGVRIPMARALDGEYGFGLSRDYRGRAVLAAYAPLPEFGLGIVQKLDTGDIHDLLLEQLRISALLIGVLVLTGSVFLYSRISPVVSKQARTRLHLDKAQRIGRIGSWEYDVTRGTVAWTEDAADVLGLGPTTDLSTIDAIFKHIPPEQRQDVRLALGAALNGGTPLDIEHQFILPDGSLRWVHVQGKVQQRTDSAPTSMIGVTHDITERVRAEEKIRRRDAFLNEAQRIAHLGSWEWRLDTDEQLWSDECFRLFGYEPNEVSASLEQFKSLVVPEDLPAVLKQVDTVIATRQPCTYQMRIRRPDGEIRYLDSHAEFTADSDGRRQRLIGTNLDITEQVRAKKRLAYLARLYAVLSKANQAIVRIRDNDELLQALCRIMVEDGGLVMAWSCRIEDGRPSHIIHWGHEDGYIETTLTIYDTLTDGQGPTRRATREGRHVLCDDIATDPDMAPWRGLALSRGYRSSAAFQIRHQDEITLINLYAPEPHFFTAEIVSLLDDLCQDVAFAFEAAHHNTLRQKAETELRQLNEELEWRVAERTRALEDVNRELESFSSAVSHDLRAPLRSIDGFSQALQRRYQEHLDDAGRDYLDRVRRAAQRMGRLIDDMLKLSRVARGPVRRQRVDLSTLARQILDELQRNDPERQVDIQVTDGLIVFGDAGLLRILLDNLLGNAWKFTRHTPRPEIRFGCRADDERPIFFVADNGAGFDPAYARKLFKEFQRLHAESEFEGTGIGLATVERVVRRHHGKVWAEGAVGQGATIHFTLPQRESARDNKA
ncbi:MAG: PAS domain-containing protein [Proteobacteria bacterium]|nr:PAS domain-containing protein [Pseudomonadota bacterium]